MMSTNTVNDMAKVVFRSVLGHHLQMFDSGVMRRPRQQIDRQHIHGVEQEHPAENGQRQGREQLVGAVKSCL